MRLVVISALMVMSGAMQTRPAEPVYDASFVLAGGTYTGTTTFTVSRTGEVTGTMKLTDPQIVDATLAGTVKSGSWTFEYPYTIPEQGCAGTVKGTGTVADDRSTVTGEVTIGGACVEQLESATFSFTRRPQPR
ncbi:MAG TPA: hypothetical protein VMN81_01810 [Vicinamibacterales bacterium]|nr:hypothetical protein [Vicinamibacterales bacterium]